MERNQGVPPKQKMKKLTKYSTFNDLKKSRSKEDKIGSEEIEDFMKLLKKSKEDMKRKRKT